MAAARGFAQSSETPAGAISPAEFDEFWEPAKIEDVVLESDGTVTLTIPATAEKGFMILRSKAAK